MGACGPARTAPLPPSHHDQPRAVARTQRPRQPLALRSSSLHATGCSRPSQAPLPMIPLSLCPPLTHLVEKEVDQYPPPWRLPRHHRGCHIRSNQEAEEGWGASGERSDPSGRMHEPSLLSEGAAAVPSAHCVFVERSPRGRSQSTTVNQPILMRPVSQAASACIQPGKQVSCR